MDWFYADGNDRKGPVTEAGLREAVQAGRVTETTLVWHEGMGDWQPYGTVVAQMSAGGASAGVSDPYAAPAAALYEEEQVAGQAGALRERPRSNSPGAALAWLGWGWQVFAASPLQWVMVTVVMVVLMIMLNLGALFGVPGAIVSSLLSTCAAYLILSGVYLMMAKAECNGPVEVGEMFLGFTHRPGAILGVAVPYGVVSTAMQTAYNQAVMGGGQPDLGKMMIWGPTMILVSIPLGMLVAYAPMLLTMHKEVGVAQSVGLSFVGCVKNILPWIVWTVVMIPLAIAAAIPCGLGFLVLGPVLALSMFKSYKDIYLEAA